MAVHDGSLFEETYNLLNAWLSIVPGNGAHNLRRLALLETNAADLSFLFTLDPGERASRHLRREALAVFETPHHTPYAFNLHVQDVGHTLVLGATGSGKSFLTQFPDDARAEVRPAHGHPGSRAQLPQAGDAAPRPLPRSRSPHQRTSRSTRSRSSRRRSICTSCTRSSACCLKATTDIASASSRTARSTRRSRTSTCSIAASGGCSRSRTCSRALWRRGCTSGSKAAVTRGSSTTSRTRSPSSDSRSSTSRRCGRIRSLLEPLLFYVLHRVTTRIQDPAEAATLKLCVMDEAWRFIQHPTLRAYVQEGLKTWRKRNAAMILATQTIDDFASADLLRTVVESCPTKLLLANPALDRRQLRRAVSVERDGTGSADGPDPPAADSCSSVRTSRRSSR